MNYLTSEPMTLAEYQANATRTLSSQGQQHLIDLPGEYLDNNDKSKIDLLHAAMGFAGEAGEVMDIVKKVTMYGKPLTEEMRMKLIEEVGDILWYIAPLCRALNVDLDYICQFNIAKLRKRYPEAYSDKDAIARVDVKPE